MGYRVSGILKLPDGAPANNAEIEFISRKNFSPLVRELKSNIKCSATGAYNVTLEYGEYAVVVYPGGTYPAALGTIILAADTVAGQDLPTLLQQAGWQPATQEYIQQIAAWLAKAGGLASQAAASATAAKVSETSAKSSESAALSSKDSAASSASTATTKAAEAASFASAALASKNASATSEANSLSSKDAAAASASTAVAAADTATQKALAAAGSEASALSSATRAEQAAQALVGAIIDAGPYNAASGVLPTPSMSSGVKRSSVWKVTGSGTAGGIELGVGDSLVYTASDNSYYKIDSTESVSSVNGRKGVVTLSSSDVVADASGTAQTLVNQHSAKSGVHQISGVNGLQGILDGKMDANIASDFGMSLISSDNDVSARSKLKLGSAATRSTSGISNNAELMEQYYRDFRKISSYDTPLAFPLGVSSGIQDASKVGSAGNFVAMLSCISYDHVSGYEAMAQWYASNNYGGIGVRVAIPSGQHTFFRNVAFRTTNNTTVDSNGFIKSASPIVRVGACDIQDDGDSPCGAGISNHEAEGVYIEKGGTGIYRIIGSSGFANDGWYIETPNDANGNKILFVEYEFNRGVIELKTFSPIYINGRCEKGDPFDIPSGRWIDIRLSMTIN